MSEPKSPSQEYRNDLAVDLSSLRSQGKREEAADLLKLQKETHVYQLSKVLRLDKPKNSRFNNRELDENILEASQSHNTVSNEASLYETFPYIENLTGAGLGVGLDQMLDIAVNSNLDEIFIIDLLPSVSLASKTLMEIGRRHHELFGKYPSPEQYLAYFQKTNIGTTLEMIAGEFNEDELQVIEQVLTEQVRDKKADITDPNAPLQLEYYLRFKSEQTEYKSWVSNAANLEKIFKMYESGKIKPILGDLTGTETMPAIADKLTANGTPLSLLYFSNAPYYISKFNRGDEFQQNIESMPVTDDTLIIETSFGRLPLPDSVASDPWMSKMMQTWDYQVQTVGDLQKQKSGEYKITMNGQQYELYDISDRAYAISEGADPNEMGVLIPMTGLLVAGVKRM